MGDCSDVAQDTRQVCEVTLLAVAPAQTGKYPQNLQVTLQTHPLEIAPERTEVGLDRDAGRTRLFPIAYSPVQNPFIVP